MQTKSIIIKLSLLILGVFLALTTLEISARLFGPKTILPEKCFRSDEILNHFHSSNKTCKFRTAFWNVTYKINSLGLRDKEYYPKKPDNTYRILILGDSFTEGWGVEQEQSYPKQLEQMLKEKVTGKKVEVINAGVASYSPVLEYLYLKEKGLQLNPDLVILAFDMTDFLEDLGFSKQTTFDETGKPLSVKPQLPAYQKVYLNNLKANTANISYHGLSSFLQKHFALLRTILSQKPNKLDPSGLFWPNEQEWSMVNKNLLLVKDLLVQNNTKFLLVTYPYQDQLKDQRLLNPLQKLATFASENNIDFLDVTSDFKNYNTQDLYIKNDVHFSPKGYEILSSSLAKYLLSNSLLF